MRENCPKDGMATIHIKAPNALRNRVLGKLRSQGTTMQTFFENLMRLIDADDVLLDTLHRRQARLARQAPPDKKPGVSS